MLRQHENVNLSDPFQSLATFVLRNSSFIAYHLLLYVPVKTLMHDLKH